MTVTSSSLVFFIIMRTDLPSMSTGRKLAQASHAAHVFDHQWNLADMGKWKAETSQGFGTAIVLGGTLEQINKAISDATEWDRNRNDLIAFGTVEDPDYRFSVPKEVVPLLDPNKINLEFTSLTESDPNVAVISKRETTCAYFFGVKQYLHTFLGHLQLHP